MGWLFPIEPYSLATSEIESFTSFVIRLASKHVVSPGVLIRLCAERTGHLPPDAQAGCTPTKPGELVRPNETNQRLVEIISACTGRSASELTTLTFLPLIKAVDRSPSAYAQDIRWCPECLAQQFSTNAECYLKLGWHLSGSTHCAVHRLPLQDRCAICQSGQNTWKARGDLYCCTNCGAALSIPTDGAHPINSWQFDSPDLVELVDLLSKLNGASLPRQAPRECLERLFNQAWLNEDEQHFWRMIPRDECLAYLYCNKRISLTTARRLAYRLGLRLVDLLGGDITRTNRQLSQGWNSNLPAKLQPNPRVRIQNPEQVRASLESALAESEEKSPSLRSLAEAVGVSTGGLWYRFPEHCAQIVGAYKQRLDDEITHKRQLALDEIRTIRREVLNGTRQPEGKKAILREVMRRTGLAKHLVRHAIGQVYNDFSPIQDPKG